MEGFVTDEERAKAWRVLKDTGAYMEGHFELSSTGKHYERFFQVPRALQHSRHARWLSVTLARVMRRSGALVGLGDGRRVTLVAPEDAGIPVAFWLGEAVNADRVLWARQRGNGWGFRPFIELDEQDHVLLVDDTVLSGSTVRSVADAITDTGASVVAVAALVDRGEPPGQVGDWRLFSLVQEPNEPFEPDECPHCAKGADVTTIKM